MVDLIAIVGRARLLYGLYSDQVNAVDRLGTELNEQVLKPLEKMRQDDGTARRRIDRAGELIPELERVLSSLHHLRSARVELGRHRARLLGGVVGPPTWTPL